MNTVLMQINPIGLIRSNVQQKRQKPIQGLCEFIDNSLSAGATAIDLFWIGKLLEIIDNGIGTDRPDIILTPAISRPIDPTSKYGMGAAMSAIILSQWGNITVASTDYSKNTYSCKMDWSKYRDRQEGEVRIGEVKREKSNSQSTGTVITISDAKKIPKDAHDAIISGISFRYASAIRAGVKINYRHSASPKSTPTVITIPAWERPKMSYSRTAFVDMGGILGKVEVFCGIVDGKNEKPGFNSYWGKRILKERDSGPCEIAGVSTANIYGEIMLDHAKFPYVNVTKDDFSNDYDPDSFYSLIAKEFSDVFEKAKTEGETIEIRNLSDEVSNDLTSLLGGSKEKRDRSGQENQNDSPIATHTGIERLSASKLHKTGRIGNSREKFPLQVRITPTRSIEVSVRADMGRVAWDIQWNPDLFPHGEKDKGSLYISALGAMSKTLADRLRCERNGQLNISFTDISYEGIFTRLVQGYS
jgi:hypothetical protein